MGSGGTPPSTVPGYFGGSIPWVSIADMTASGKYVQVTAKTLTDAGLSASAAKLYEPDVVLYAMYASLGECALAVGQVSSSQAILGIKPGSELDRDFLYYFLDSIKPLVKSMGQHGTQANLNAGMVRNLRLPLPPIAEQRRIAKTLANADELIVMLEKLVAKEEAIKRGMVQQLLTGKIRLPGFGTTWIEVELGELLTFKNGLNKGSKYFGVGTLIINFMDVMDGPIITSENVVGRVTLTTDEIKRFSAKRGDLFFTRTSETVAEVGTAATLVDDIPNAVFSGFVLRGRPSTADIDSRFVAHLFQLDAIRQQVRSSATYTTRALTNGHSLGRILVRLPEGAEQRVIADLIDDVDREIAALRRRLDKTRNVKRGMMQELLTGSTRLPVREAAE